MCFQDLNVCTASVSAVQVWRGRSVRRSGSVATKPRSPPSFNLLSCLHKSNWLDDLRALTDA